MFIGVTLHILFTYFGNIMTTLTIIVFGTSSLLLLLLLSLLLILLLSLLQSLPALDLRPGCCDTTSCRFGRQVPWDGLRAFGVLRICGFGFLGLGFRV